MEYYIYHIPGVKIGCTNQIEQRIKDQGFNDYELLETHTDIYKASDREQELQKEYGYTVDRAPYYLSVRNRPKWNDKTRYKVWLDPIARAKSNSPENKLNRTLKHKEWMKKDNYKTAIKNIKGVRKPHILSVQQEQFIIDNSFKAKNQFTPIPEGKLTTKQLAEMFKVTQSLVKRIIRRGIVT